MARSTITTKHDCLILDACCVMNLYASGRVAEIIAAIKETAVVAAYVVEVEALTVYNSSRRAAPGEREPINLQPLVASGLLTIARLETEAEQSTFVALSSKRLDDGEAITLALAAERNWAVATDDRAAQRVMAQEYAQIQLISTPELFKYWQEVKRPSPITLQAALTAVEQRANYLVGRRHPFYDWWQAARANPAKR